MTIIQTIPALSLAAHQGFIGKTDPITGKVTADFVEVDRLISIAQDAPTHVRIDTTTDGNGAEKETEVVVWDTTHGDPEQRRKIRCSSAALEKLTNAWIPLLHKTAGRVSAKAQEKGLSPEDAFSQLVTEFAHYVRNRYVVGSMNFARVIPDVLAGKLADLERTCGVIVIAANSQYRFMKLMRDHDFDAVAAYKDCRSGQFEPKTFMAILDALYPKSLDGDDFGGSYLNDMSGDDDNGDPLDEALFKAGHFNEDPADIVVRASLAQVAFDAVDHKQEQMARLKFGFNDPATRNLRVTHGFDREDAADRLMSDEDVARIFHLQRQTFRRRLAEALDLMRAALDETDYDGTSYRSQGQKADPAAA